MTQLRPLPKNTVVPVSGVSFRQDDVVTMRVDDDVILRHDTSNTRDQYAVTVETTDGRLLGYVPRSNDLNARLVTAQPGGVWSGRVIEVLGTETVGLRVKIGVLIGTVDARFGAALPGLRHTSDGYVDEHDPTRADEATAAQRPATPPARQVHTRTGRLLGELLEVSGNRVRVQTPAGVVAYPAVVVVIDDNPTGPSTAIA